eukprot:g3756.t1
MLALFPSSLFSVLLCFGAAEGGSSSLPWIRASNVPGDVNFYDEFGRVRLFHGSNRVQKSQPWYVPEMADDDAVAAHMQLLGFTVVRLGFMWSGFNPSPGVYNETYINIIKGTVGRLERHGVYSLLNVQMDGLSSKFCTYDGAPLWVINKSSPVHPFPWPLPGNGSCSHSGSHLDVNIMTEASVTAYQDIFDNNHGMLDDFVSFWRNAAGHFKDVSGIIGFDIMNEPFAGNFYRDPTLLLPGIAAKKNLQRLYDAAALAIRESGDDRHVLFYEPTTWGMLSGSKDFGSGFEHVPGGEQYRNRSAFSYHYYCHSFLPSYNSHPVLQRVVCDDGIAPLVYKAVREDLKRLGGAQMQTEGMQCSGVQSECTTNMDALDANGLWNWIDWNFSMDNSSQAESWARTYARAVAGRPLNMSFDSASKQFDFCYQLDAGIDAATEIFASTKFSYPQGFRVSTSSNVKATAIGDIVTVTPSEEHETSGTDASGESEACVRIVKEE